MESDHGIHYRIGYIATHSDLFMRLHVTSYLTLSEAIQVRILFSRVLSMLFPHLLILLLLTTYNPLRTLRIRRNKRCRSLTNTLSNALVQGIRLCAFIIEDMIDLFET